MGFTQHLPGSWSAQLEDSCCPEGAGGQPRWRQEGLNAKAAPLGPVHSA